MPYKDKKCESCAYAQGYIKTLIDPCPKCVGKTSCTFAAVQGESPFRRFWKNLLGAENATLLPGWNNDPRETVAITTKKRGL